MTAVPLPAVPHPSGGSRVPHHRQSLSEPGLGRTECTASHGHTETSVIVNGLREMLPSPFGKKNGFKSKKDPILEEQAA